MNIWAIIPLVTCCFYLLLLFISLPQIKKRTNRVFVYYLAVAAFWSFSAFILHLEAPPDSTLLWNRILVVALVWTLISYYHFVRAYTGRPAGIGVLLGYVVVAATAVASFTGHIVKYSYVRDGILYHDLGAAVFYISLVSLFFVSAVILTLLKKYRTSTDPIDRNRTMYLIVGWIILVLLTATNNIPSLAVIPLDHIGNFINALIITYVITKLNLFDISLVARRALSYGILVAFIIGVAIAAVFFGVNVLGDSLEIYLVLYGTAIIALLVLVTRNLIPMLETVIDRLFFRKTYSSRLALLNFSERMGNILDLDELAKEMLPSMTIALRITHAGLMFQDTESGDFKTNYNYSKSKENMETDLALSPDSPIIEWLDKNSAPLYVSMMGSIPSLKSMWQSEKEQISGSGLGVLYPLKSRGKLIGVLGLGYKQSGGPYSQGDMQLVSRITNQAGIIIENAQLYHQAKVRANTDELTGLYNHRSFHERMEQEIARGSRFGGTFSLIMLDIDLFKAYNDIYGHLAGDQVLRKVAHYITSSIRSVDLAFRYGGEEFAIILPEARLDDAYKVAERIRKTVESKTSSRAMPITASLGVGNWPNDGVMKEEVIGLADAALYRAKQTGRNRTCLSSDVLKPGSSLIGIELEAKPRALSIIYALAATVDAKDSYTYGHSRKVSEYAVALAEAMHLPPEKVNTIRAAALLHDIGKVGVPDSILNKKSPLTEEEWKPIKAHPELGVEILRHVIDLVNCLPAILHHHEHYDGSGYPAGLAAEAIPVEAKILSVADAYDAMTSPRPYREQLSLEDALEELRRCAGTQFAPEIVEMFCKIVKPTPQVEDRKTGEKNAEE